MDLLVKLYNRTNKLDWYHINASDLYLINSIIYHIIA